MLVLKRFHYNIQRERFGCVPGFLIQIESHNPFGCFFIILNRKSADASVVYEFFLLLSLRSLNEIICGRKRIFGYGIIISPIGCIKPDRIIFFSLCQLSFGNSAEEFPGIYCGSFLAGFHTFFYRNRFQRCCFFDRNRFLCFIKRALLSRCFSICSVIDGSTFCFTADFHFCFLTDSTSLR